jgi:hypothetical protein
VIPACERARMGTGVKSTQAAMAWRVARRSALAGVLVLALAGCAAKAPVVQAPEQAASQAAAAKQKEEQETAARIAAEQDALAKKAEESEKRQVQEVEGQKLPPEFGTPQVIGPVPGKSSATATPAVGGVTTVTPVPVPTPDAPLSPTGAVPFDKAFPPIRDRVVRIGILSGASQAGSGQNLARMLVQEEKKYMEETLGLGVKVSFVSETDRPQTRRTLVRYRGAFLKAAVHIAALLPQPQQIESMADAEADRHGVDILVQMGTELR